MVFILSAFGNQGGHSKEGVLKPEFFEFAQLAPFASANGSDFKIQSKRAEVFGDKAQIRLC